MDDRPLHYIANALDMTEAGVYELLEQTGAKNIQYEGAGTPDPLLEAPTMPKKLKTYEELLIENMQLRNENSRLRRLHACDANPVLARN
ncbi:hypothetical protein [Exiguobacterium oxidotolerans]|uniref:hypothetical protein n=1 Tax=Exiguobacterium oxidotolerans TaxID=223958 RepID=UPI001269E2C8|nr:hypothetical protein [Exiguobacterium oxidotolerans]